MRTAKVFVHGVEAGILAERPDEGHYSYVYRDDYSGPPVSLTMPVSVKKFHFESFPPFFEGLLPEGVQLEGLLRIRKIDREDYFSQLVATGTDLVGAVTVKEVSRNE